MIATASHNSRQVCRAACSVLAHQQIEVDKDALQAPQQCPLDRARGANRWHGGSTTTLQDFPCGQAGVRPTQGLLWCAPSSGVLHHPKQGPASSTLTGTHVT